MRIAKTHEKGQVLIAVVILFSAILTTVVVGLVSPILGQVQISRNLQQSKQSFFVAESLAEDITYRFKTGKSVSASESLTLAGAEASANITTAGGTQQITVDGDVNSLARSVYIELSQGSGIAFHYASQAGLGGFDLKNSSGITGNVYSEGPVIGAGGNIIGGDVVSSGQNGLVYGIHATSSVYAHAIGNSSLSTTIDKNAYYATAMTNTTVGGTPYPGSPDQMSLPLPISDAQIAEWEGEAALGGVITSPCPYQISEDADLGPVKIACDLQISGDPSITLRGHVWVMGDITIQNTAVMRIDPSLGARSIAIIADDPANQIGKSRITLQNATRYEGSGTDPSVVLLLSQNRSAEAGGGTAAIKIQNTAKGDLFLYAGHGKIELQNSANLNEVTAYRIELQNSATVVYKTGLANQIFTSGPSGGYTIGEWGEVQ